MTSFNIINHIVGSMPQMTVNSKKVNRAVNWIGRNISSPENRFILGASAIISQPLIDLNNKKVDEETRKVSAARTVAKIIAGTLTGVIVRAGCIKAIDTFSKLPQTLGPNVKNKWLHTLFTPTETCLEDLGYYKKALGTIVSLFVMLITNFAIDAPLTKLLTNKFVDDIHKCDAKKKKLAEVKDV